ncbi:TRAP transporter small permease [Sediminivirga luteola]|uniref:Tripartite ATP-independent periplasmic transporters DctQ component domain-containing protein n=1 Tax=Sediminivirga luteola TaxID=1774748 RepID=A0A8J2XJR9_9MICO|nr:TRAP transporter small permease subunit [Sediminivirga luteola]MCI2265129.1 TRAP transporter small permease subunit [Sediminivirga luteola]GGA22009.1 hypothetical protein GCM10011333_26290 [Sediminivirga luteola]
MFDTILTRLENTLIVAAFGTITVLSFVNVVSRYLLHGSMSFTTELVINLAVLLTMVGAAAGVRLGTHPGFEVLPTISRGALRTVLVALITLATLAFFLMFLWLGLEMVSRQMATGRLTPALHWPQWVFSLALPAGAALGAIRAVQVAVVQVNRVRKEEAS